ncbi:MAG TPA: hypothetical protein VI259_03690 [Gemmatimonadaceae bacterium]
MLALRVTINGKHSIVAGTEDLSVLSAIVTLTGKLGAKTVAPGRGKPDMFVSVGGLTARGGRRRDEHLRWTPHVKLNVGDRVLVELIKAAKSDKIVERSKAEERSERTYYHFLKKQYLHLKKKYEPQA